VTPPLTTRSRDSRHQLAAASTSPLTAGGTSRDTVLWLPFRFMLAALCYDWPGGSGQTGGYGAVPPGTGSLLSNGSFETWTGTAPTGWTLTGNVSKGTTAFQGSNALQFVGDGTTLSTASQAFGSTTGSPSLPGFLTQYAVLVWAQADLAASGTLAVEFTDGTAAVISDFAGTPNQTSFNLATLVPGVWTPFVASVRVPQIVPAVMQLRLALTAPLSTGNLYLDSVTMNPLTPFYPDGPSFVVYSGSSDFVQGERDFLAA
jgi:hypothetical protein